MGEWPDDTSQSRQLYNRGLKVFPGGITRIIPWQEPFPVYAAYGKGAYVTDVDGTTRMDFLNNFASLIHGHAHPRVIEAVTRQLTLGTAFTMPTECEVALAELLCERIDSADLIRFSNSGSEAVMAAVKAARAYTGRPAIVKVEGGYHGHYDYVEVSLDPPQDAWESPPRSIGYSEGVPQGLLEDVLVVPFNDPVTAEKVIRENKDRIGAVLLDAAPSYLGFTPVSKEFTDKIRELSTEIGAVMILDEVITFRLDYGGAQKKFDIKPDLTVLGKIIGGGFPIGALAGSREIMQVFDHRPGKPPLPWSGTFTANPVSMTAGRVTLETLTEDAIKYINDLGAQVRQGLTRAFEAVGYPGQVTGVGSMFKIMAHDRPVFDFRSQKHTEEESAVLLELQRLLVGKDYHVAGTGMGFLSTPMVAEEMDNFCNAVEDCLRKIKHPDSTW